MEPFRRIPARKRLSASFGRRGTAISGLSQYPLAGNLVELTGRIELPTDCLQNSCSATELRQRRGTGSRTSKPNFNKFGKIVLGQNSYFTTELPRQKEIDELIVPKPPENRKPPGPSSFVEKKVLFRPEVKYFPRLSQSDGLPPIPQ